MTGTLENCPASPRCTFPFLSPVSLLVLHILILSSLSFPPPTVACSSFLEPFYGCLDAGFLARSSSSPCTGGCTSVPTTASASPLQVLICLDDVHYHSA